MTIATGRRLAMLAAMAVLTGCGGNTLGALGDIIGAATGVPGGAGQAQQGQISVEIRAVNTRQQTIEVATQQGQTGAVRYDANTVVVYQNQQYPITALERGDVALLTVQDVQGTIYASRIDVQQSVQQRTGTTTTTGSGSIVQLTGRVSQVDQSNGTFLLQTNNGNVLITLPYSPPQATLDYFRRLRNGDTVRLEATPLASGRAEIYRFL